MDILPISKYVEIIVHYMRNVKQKICLLKIGRDNECLSYDISVG